MPFKIGDTVRLKSGGPLMTVTEVGTSNQKPMVWVTWFKDEETKIGHFPPDSLEADDGMPPMPSGGGFRAPV